MSWSSCCQGTAFCLQLSEALQDCRIIGLEFLQVRRAAGKCFATVVRAPCLSLEQMLQRCTYDVGHNSGGWACRGWVAHVHFSMLHACSLGALLPVDLAIMRKHVAIGSQHTSDQVEVCRIQARTPVMMIVTTYAVDRHFLMSRDRHVCRTAFGRRGHSTKKKKHHFPTGHMYLYSPYLGLGM